MAKKFPDLTGDGKVTQKDILKGRGVKLSRGGKAKKKRAKKMGGGMMKKRMKAGGRAGKMGGGMMKKRMKRGGKA